VTSGSLITAVGKNLIWQRLFQSSETVVDEFQMGTGTTTAAESDTNLTTAIGGKYNFSPNYPTFDDTNGRVTVRGFVPSTDLNGNTLAESGLFNTDGTPILLNHDVFIGITKTASKQIIMTWNIKLENVS